MELYYLITESDGFRVAVTAEEAEKALQDPQFKRVYCLEISKGKLKSVEMQVEEYTTARRRLKKD